LHQLQFQSYSVVVPQRRVRRSSQDQAQAQRIDLAPRQGRIASTKWGKRRYLAMETLFAPFSRRQLLED